MMKGNTLLEKVKMVEKVLESAFNLKMYQKVCQKMKKMRKYEKNCQKFRKCEKVYLKLSKCNTIL